jgi:hypothetical protein
MIITVFVTTHSARDHWRAELLEQSWIQCGQAGELVRLVACPANATLPLHRVARVVRTLPYDPHPYLADQFPGYNLPAALFEWLITEAVDATLLLLDLDSVLVKPIAEEVVAGGALGNRWQQWPAGQGPFGLGKPYRKLEDYCVNRELKPAKVQFPVLIHSSDLHKMAARWLEWTGLIRSTIRLPQGLVLDAHKLAYTLAAAEYHIPHKAQKLATISSERKVEVATAVLDYRLPVESPEGKIVWDPETYQPWSPPDVTRARAGAGREFLRHLDSYISQRESGGLLEMLRPRRCYGVREARMPDRMMLEIPGAAEPLQLNASASAIWQLCDNRRSLAEIVGELQTQYEAPREVLCEDVERTAIHFRSRGAVQLDVIHP